jgi:hypothetical protein
MAHSSGSPVASALHGTARYGAVTTYRKRDVMFLQNILGTTPESLAVSVLGDAPVTDTAILMGNVRAFRGFAPRDGRIFLAKSSYPEAAEYSRYLEACGLVPPGSMDNVIFVDDLTDFRHVMQCCASVGRERGITYRLAPYQHFGALYDIAESCGLSIMGPTRGVIDDMELFSDKSKLRDLIETVMPFHYPRVVLSRGVHDYRRESVVAELNKAITYARSLPERLPDMLFVQYTVASGGYGNLKVNWDFIIKEPNGDRRQLGNVEGLADYLIGTAKNASLEVTPFLPLVDSYSYGITVWPDAITWVGKRHQILDEDNRYDGFYLDIDVPHDESSEHEIAICMHVAQIFREAGFYSTPGMPFGIDFFRYRGPGGVVRVGVAEANVRLDGTSFLLGLCAKVPRWRYDFIRGRLSVEQHDASRVPNEISGTTSFLGFLEDRGIPIARASSPYGVTLLTAPIGASDKKVVMTGFVSPSDRARRELVERYCDVTGNLVGS